MKLNFLLAALLGLLLALAGCGGGGSGGNSTTYVITGSVEDVAIGVPNPVAQVACGGVTTTSSTIDGSFSLTVPSGVTRLTVNRMDGSAVFAFTIPAVTGNESVGQFWIGPSRVSVSGTAIDATTLKAISGASVNVGGATGTTASDGSFTVSGVAYAASGLFPDVPVTISATGYISSISTVGNNVVTGSTVNVGQFGLVPASSSPPGAPYNIYGRVSPLAVGTTAVSPGTVVTLSIGSTPYRSTTVGIDGNYYFWVPAGTYTLSFTKTGYTAPSIPVTLTASNQVLSEDATLTANP